MSSNESVKICEHMNKDHRVSLADYVGYFTDHALSINNPRHSVKLIDVTLSKFTLLYSQGTTSRSVDLQFEPPLESLAQARFRFISLAFKAADKAKRSPYQVTEFVLPTKTKQKVATQFTLGLMVLMVATVSNGLISSPPSSGVWRTIYQISKWLLPTTLSLHLLEYFTVVKSLLKYHRVPPSVSRKYFWATFFGGFTAWVPLKQRSKELAQRRAEYERKLANL